MDLVYDRQLLLLGAKRNAELELQEVERYGRDSYRDPDYVSIYGLRPADWYARGVRLLGRTAVECTRDSLADAIGKSVAATAGGTGGANDAVVIDPFAGSGNTLYWLLRHLPGTRGVAFELDPTVYALTARNLAALAAPIRILNVDYQSGLRDMSVAPDPMIVIFVAPPWGTALDREKGLDLGETTPPIGEIVDFVEHRFPLNRLLFAIQIYEKVDPDSIAELGPRFAWMERRVFALNAPGENHGVLLGTRGFVP